MNIYQQQVNSLPGALGPVSFVPWGGSTLTSPYLMRSQPLEYTRNGYVPPRDATAYQNLIGFGKSRKSRTKHGKPSKSKRGKCKKYCRCKKCCSKRKSRRT